MLGSNCCQRKLPVYHINVPLILYILAVFSESPLAVTFNFTPKCDSHFTELQCELTSSWLHHFRHYSWHWDVWLHSVPLECNSRILCHRWLMSLQPKKTLNYSKRVSYNYCNTQWQWGWQLEDGNKLSDVSGHFTQCNTLVIHQITLCVYKIHY